MMTLAFLSMSLLGQANALSTPEQPQAREGRYRLYWDDKLDGQGPVVVETATTTGQTKFRDVQILVKDGVISGKSLDETGDKISGQAAAGEGTVRMLTFWTTRKGVTTSYHIVMGMHPHTGTWVDTKGGRGDFSLSDHW